MSSSPTHSNSTRHRGRRAGDRQATEAVAPRSRESIITGCDRQISLLESAASTALKDEAGPGGGQEFVFEAQSRIDEVAHHAVTRIQRFADPGFDPPAR